MRASEIFIQSIAHLALAAASTFAVAAALSHVAPAPVADQAPRTAPAAIIPERSTFRVIRRRR